VYGNECDVEAWILWDELVEILVFLRDEKLVSIVVQWTLLLDVMLKN
jgi:hypothetical protein